MLLKVCHGKPDTSALKNFIKNTDGKDINRIFL